MKDIEGSYSTSHRKLEDGLSDTAEERNSASQVNWGSMRAFSLYTVI